MDREKYISEIVANSPLTEESLAERCNDGLEAIHSDVMANAEDEDEESESMTENTDETVREITEAELEELVANRVDEKLAERESQSEKESLASEIVANSAEYENTESVLDDFPTVAALETKKSEVEPSAALPGRGASTVANAGGADEYPDMEIGGDFE